MAIEFYDSKKIFHLSTPGSSYVFMILSNGVPMHLYYGKRLDSIEGIEETYPYGGITGFSPCDIYIKDKQQSTDCLPQEYPTYGSADLRKPAFHAEYPDGSRVTKLAYVSHEIKKGKPGLSGLPATYVESDSEADTLELKLRDEKTGLVLVISYTAFNNADAVTRSVRVENNGDEEINIKAVMSFNIDFYRNDFEFMHLHGAWACERQVERVPVSHMGMKIESRRGSSSHNHSPFFALVDKNADEEHGEVYGFSFVYSGNFEAGVETDHNDMVRAYMGINSFDFNWLLKPGESFNAPEAVMVYSDEGIGKMSGVYHKLYRTRLCRGKYRDAERPVLINNWEATYFDFNEEKILNIAKKAKETGIELMVLDDGWFGKRDADNCSLGDWYPDTKKLPNGIKGLAEKVTALGMKFGLWFEPEMISPDSDLYRAHPDWCLHVEGRDRTVGRSQLILDLSRDDVCDYIIGFLSKALEEAPISYIKWDMNRNMSEIGSAKLPPERQSETAHRYMLGLYRVLETVTQKFPDVLFEGCSGGGGRFDAGMLYYFVQYWTSDDTDAYERMKLQDGTSIVMPSSTMGAHVSAVPNHQTGRTTPLETRGNTAFCGQFGYELDITKMSDEEIKTVAEQIKMYKSIRGVIQKGDMYRICSLFSGNKAVWEYVSEDKNTVVVYVGTTMCHPNKMADRIRLRALDKDAKYAVRDSGEIYSGSVLMNCGAVFANGLFGDFASRIVVLDKVK